MSTTAKVETAQQRHRPEFKLRRTQGKWVMCDFPILNVVEIIRPSSIVALTSYSHVVHHLIRAHPCAVYDTADVPYALVIARNDIIISFLASNLISDGSVRSGKSYCFVREACSVRFAHAHSHTHSCVSATHNRNAICVSEVEEEVAEKWQWTSDERNRFAFLLGKRMTVSNGMQWGWINLYQQLEDACLMESRRWNNKHDKYLI